MVLHDAPLWPVSVHASAHHAPGKPRATRCCRNESRAFYPDPSRGPRPDAGGRLVDGRDDPADPPDSVGGGDWRDASAAGAVGPGTMPRSSPGPGNRDGKSKTPCRNHRRGNAVERMGLARGSAPGPAGRTGHGRPSRGKVSFVVGRLLFGGHHRNPDRAKRSGFRFSACGAHSLRHCAAPAARMMRPPHSRREFRKLRFSVSAYT